jgi:DNA repair and recombination RAD54-like protein
MSLTEHEKLIQNILSKPFKVPIKDYIPEYSTKTLGMAKTLVRR